MHLQVDTSRSSELITYSIFALDGTAPPLACCVYELLAPLFVPLWGYFDVIPNVVGHAPRPANILRRTCQV